MTAKVKKEGVAEKQTAGTKQQPLRLRENENVTVNAPEVRRFLGALSIILRPCKMMDASFAKCKTSHIISFVPSVAQAFIWGDFPPSQ